MVRPSSIPRPACCRPAAPWPPRRHQCPNLIRGHAPTLVNQTACLATPHTQDAAYDGTTVILTGATGFLGKVVLEKILWSLRGVKKIYVLLRPRGDTPAEARLAKEVLSWQCFDRLREDRPDFEGAWSLQPMPVSRHVPLPAWTVSCSPEPFRCFKKRLV